ncbi:MAG: YdcF family protein [Acidobacteria bacterium]|nr:YdcF family protein [Acidobacteriota bacterium]MBI3470102.1 YdcF family protein [Candidatus Solibacter usitatus]
MRWRLLAAACLIPLVLFSGSFWFSLLGGLLIDAQEPSSADIAVVLAGDTGGHRILHAAELVRRGLAPRVLVSGPRCCYGVRESDLAVRYAVEHGYPEAYFLKFPHAGTTTIEEAHYLIPELRRLGVRSFLLVTSDYHTRRASRIFRRLAPDLRMCVVAAPDQYFRRDGWWRTRQGRKTFYLEWSKTLAEFAGF